jgi:hypothetical protein
MRARSDERSAGLYRVTNAFWRALKRCFQKWHVHMAGESVRVAMSDVCSFSTHRPQWKKAESMSPDTLVAHFKLLFAQP